MSNILRVRIDARVPWTWASDMPAQEAACFASTFLNTTNGLKLHQFDDGYEPSEHGGITHMVIVQITGDEAVSWKYLSRLVAALEALGEVTIAEAMDVQWPDQEHRWERISGTYYDPAPSLTIEPYGQAGDGSWSYNVHVPGEPVKYERSLQDALRRGRWMLQRELQNERKLKAQADQ